MQTIDTNGYQKTQYKQFTQTIHTNNSFKTAHCKQFLETAIREFNANSIYQLLSHNSFQTAIRTVIREIITNNSHRLLSDNFYLFIYLFIHITQDWTTTKRQGVTRKWSTKRLNHTGNFFRKNLQLQGFPNGVYWQEEKIWRIWSKTAWKLQTLDLQSFRSKESILKAKNS